MTSISDAFETPTTAPTAGRTAAVVRKVADRAGVAAKVRYAAGAVAYDVRTAWPWHGDPPTLADLWAARIPDLDRVPGANRALHAAWVVFNHLALVWTALLAIPLWVLQHPARTLLAALVTAPLIAVWLIG